MEFYIDGILQLYIPNILLCYYKQCYEFNIFAECGLEHNILLLQFFIFIKAHNII